MILFDLVLRATTLAILLGHACQSVKAQLEPSSGFAKQGQEHVYRVEGQLITGIPDINRQFSGLQFFHRQRVFPLNNGVIHVETRDLKVDQVHQVLTDKDGDWNGEYRKIKGAKTPDIGPENLGHLSSTVDMVVENGVVKSIFVPENLPEWAVNMKRAQAAEFNLPRMASKNHNDASGRSFEVFEDSLYGRCQVSYTLTENDPYLPAFNSPIAGKNVGDKPWRKAVAQFCPKNPRIFEIVKTVNFSSCVTGKSAFLSYNSPVPELDPSVTPSGNDIASVWSRSLITRYLACGQSIQDYQILKIVQTEKYCSGLRGTEKLVAGSTKTISLESINILSDQSSGRVSTQPRLIQSLGYNFDANPNPTLTNINNGDGPSSSQFVDLSSIVFLTPSQKQEMPVQALLDLQNVAKNVVKGSSDKSEILFSISKVHKLLNKLNYRQIQQIGESLGRNENTMGEEKVIQQNIFYDSLSSAGTNPAASYILDRVLDGTLRGEQAAQTLSTLPLHIRTPNQSLLDLFFKVVQTKNSDQVEASAILAFSTILHMACINKKIASSRYPIAQYGEFCSEADVLQKFLPYFEHRLVRALSEKESSKRTQEIVTLVSGMGNIGSARSLIHVVRQVVESPTTDSFVKSRAIFALQNVINPRYDQNEEYDQLVSGQVIPYLSVLAFDHSMTSKIRNAAVAVLLDSEYSDTALWQKIAHSTWSEESPDVESFIRSTISNLAKLDNPATDHQRRIKQKSVAVLHLVKPSDRGESFERAHTFFRNGDDESINGGWSQHLFYFQSFGSSSSFLPNDIYYRNMMALGNGAIVLKPFRWSVSGNIFSTLMDQFLQEPKEGHKYVQEIFKELGICMNDQQASLKTDQLQGSIHVKLADQIERLWNVNHETLNYLKTFATQKGGNLRSLNYQKYARLLDQFFAMPTIFGLPIVHRLKIPALVSLRGHGSLKGDSLPYTFQTDFSPVLSWRIQRSLTIVSPFTLKMYQAGEDRSFTLDAPFSALFKFTPKSSMEISVTPRHLGDSMPKGPINIISVTQLPYTAVLSDDLEPIRMEPKNGDKNTVEPILDPSESDDFQFREFGQNAIGLHFSHRTVVPKNSQPDEFESGSESSSNFHHFFRQLFQIYSSAHRSSEWGGFLQPKRLRRAQGQLILNLDTSQTKTINFFLARGPAQDKWSARQIFQNNALDGQFALAVVGKVDPLTELGQTQHKLPSIFEKVSQCTVRLLATMQYNDPGEVMIGQLALGSTAQEASLNLPSRSTKSFHSMQSALASPVSPDGRWSRDKGALIGQMTLTFPPAASTSILHRENLLNRPLSVGLSASFKAGPNLQIILPFLTVDGTMRRNDAMTQWAKEGSPQAKQCKEDEESRFTTSMACMTVSREQATALNEWEVDIQQAVATSVSDDFWYQTEDFLKAVFYTKMTQFNNGSGIVQIRPTVKLLGHFTPDTKHFSFQLQKPAYTLHFENLRTHFLAQAMLPLRSNQKPVQLAHGLLPILFDSPSQVNFRSAMCSVDGNNVQTFNNFTYTFDQHLDEKTSQNDCTYLLTSDCWSTPSNPKLRSPDTVLIHNLNSGSLKATSDRHITVLLEGQTTIELRFQQVNSRSRSTIFVNGRQILKLPHSVRIPIKSDKPLPPASIFGTAETREIAEISDLSVVNGDGQTGVQVKSQKLMVIADGQRLVLYRSRVQSEQTCGICGSSDLTRGVEFRGPQNTHFSSGTLMVASYLTNSKVTPQNSAGNRCQVKAEIRSELEKERQEEESAPNLKL